MIAGDCGERRMLKSKTGMRQKSKAGKIILKCEGLNIEFWLETVMHACLLSETYPTVCVFVWYMDTSQWQRCHNVVWSKKSCPWLEQASLISRYGQMISSVWNTTEWLRSYEEENGYLHLPLSSNKIFDAVSKSHQDSIRSSANSREVDISIWLRGHFGGMLIGSWEHNFYWKRTKTTLEQQTSTDTYRSTLLLPTQLPFCHSRVLGESLSRCPS